jgi:hypothetical protein
MKLTTRSRAGLAVAACVVLGAAGGIVGSAAAPSKNSAKKSSTTQTGGWRNHGGPPPGGGPGGPVVHSDEVVLNKAGTAYITATDDNGTVKSISGNDVTITEGVGKVAYKDVTVTLPGSATVDRNGTKAKVTDLKAGDRIHVSQSSDGTFVFASDASWKPSGRADGHGPGGPDGPGGPGGPPPMN